MAEAQFLTCSRCEASISPEELNAGLAVRVDGQLVCQMCVDTLPGEAVVRINQVRALRGMEATTYAVKIDRLPRAQLFSFTTSSNIAQHRRKLASDGFFEAPPLPPPAQRNRIPTTEEVRRIATDRVARGVFPNKLPMLLAGGATVLLLAGIAVAMTLASPTKSPAVAPATAKPAEVPAPEPVRPLKTRIDYPVDAVQAWTQASQDSACPSLVLQSIAQELIRKRTAQLVEADQALAERRLDDAAALANAMSLPDDIAFRDLRRSENELRDRLLAARTLASAPTPTPPPATVVDKPQPPVPQVQPPQPPIQTVPPQPSAQPTDGRLTLRPDDADLSGTELKTQDAGGRRNIGFWNNAADSARWTVSVTTPGRYRADLSVSVQNGPCEVVLEIGQRQVEGKIPETGSWDRYLTVSLGVIDIPAAGMVAVRLRPKAPPQWKAVNVAGIVLVPTSDAETAIAIPPAPPKPNPVTKPPAAPITAWSGAFATGGRDRPPRSVPLDGSEHVPSGLPGGVSALFRTFKSQALKRHAAFLDLAGANATGGGLVMLVHPGRNDRNEIVPSLTDGKGTTVKLEPIALSDDVWSTVVVPLPSDPAFDASSLITLALEDGPKSAHIPDDSGFLIANVVIVNGRAATQADLGLRPSALLPDPNRLRNLPRLLDIIAKNRKKPNAQKLIETGRVRFLLGSWGNDQDWRLALRRQLEPLTSGKQPTTMMAEFTFTDAWLDALTKAKDGALDPAAIHVGVLWTGGDEIGAATEAGPVINTFWKRRLDQIIEAGVLPVVVLGPNRKPADRRPLSDQVWQQLITLPPVRLYGMPVIDLRALPTADDGSWDPATATLARQLVADALGETFFTLRRLGAVK
jgi:hypothetical protein